MLFGAAVLSPQLYSYPYLQVLDWMYLELDIFLLSSNLCKLLVTFAAVST